MKKLTSIKKLVLQTQTLQNLSAAQLTRAAGNSDEPEPWSGNMSCVDTMCCASEWCTCVYPDCR